MSKGKIALLVLIVCTFGALPLEMVFPQIDNILRALVFAIYFGFVVLLILEEKHE